ncbi:MAG: PEP-CTERM sorting domain-containing protein [Fimbriimonadales bacterium]
MKVTRILTLAGLAVAAVSANALTLVTNRANINANDSIDWGQFGAPFTGVVDGSMGTSSVYNMPFMITDGNGFERRDQWTGGWAGDFTQGDKLMWTQGGRGFELIFGYTLKAVGAQIQRDQFGAFTATIEAFDGLGDSLGSFTINSNSTANNDGSAAFLGVESNAHDIARIVYTVDAGQTGNDFALNEVSMNACVPEPGTIAALGLGAIALIRRKRSK